jgi:hypothetical protein
MAMGKMNLYPGRSARSCKDVVLHLALMWEGGDGGRRDTGHISDLAPTLTHPRKGR